MTTFRGNRIDNNEEVFGYYVYDGNFNQHFIFHQTYSPIVDHLAKTKIHPKSLAQYTTINDKDGKEIYGSIEYEKGKMSRGGDICRWVDTEGRIYIKEVNWNKRSACWDFGVIQYNLLVDSGYYQTKMEILGSAYTKPELLEKK